MTELRTRRDGGGTAKGRLVLDLTVALARADVSRILELVTDDVRWSSIGRRPVVGADAFCRAVTRHGPATILTVEHVFADAAGGAVDGFVELGRRCRAFCHVFELQARGRSRVSGITTYSIAVES